MTAQVRYGGAPAQLHADKAYDIAGRPAMRRRGIVPTNRRQPAHGPVRGWPREQPTVGLTRDWWLVEGQAAHETTSVRVRMGSPLCGAAFPQVDPDRQGRSKVFWRLAMPIKTTCGAPSLRDRVAGRNDRIERVAAADRRRDVAA